jgi:hypothetical protein
MLLKCKITITYYIVDYLDVVRGFVDRDRQTACLSSLENAQRRHGGAELVFAQNVLEFRAHFVFRHLYAGIAVNRQR